MKLNKLLVLLLVFASAIIVSAQQNDEKYKKWSKDEAQKVLSTSNWTKTYQAVKGSASADLQQIAREQSQSASRGGSDPRRVERDFGPAPIVVRLHSGTPIRQAIVRLRQIDAGYDKMDEKQRADFDKSAQAFIDAPIYKKYYVVTITKFAEKAGSTGIDEAMFQRLKFDDLKGLVRLVNDKNEKRELVQFTPPNRPGDPAVLFFQRFDEQNKPLISLENKEFKLVFDNEFLSDRNPYAYLLPRTFDFKVSKITNGDQIDF